jgi:hypothetical protein
MPVSTLFVDPAFYAGLATFVIPAYHAGSYHRPFCGMTFRALSLFILVAYLRQQNPPPSSSESGGLNLQESLVSS